MRLDPAVPLQRGVQLLLRPVLLTAVELAADPGAGEVDVKDRDQLPVVMKLEVGPERHPHTQEPVDELGLRG